MIKKAFILGAGLGTRLRPLTNVRPKPLVPLFRKTLVQHAIERAISLGIEDVAINTHHLSEVWEEYFPTTGMPTYLGVNGIPARPSIYKEANISLFNEPKLLETGGGIRNLAHWLGNEDALVYNGDIFCTIPLEPLIETHSKGEFEATLILRSDGPAKHIALEGNQVIDIRRKLDKADGQYQFTGIYAIKGEMLKRITPNKKESIIDTFLKLAAEGKLGAVVVNSGDWFDVGTRNMYLSAHANQNIIPNDVDPISPLAQVSNSARITNSWISGHSVISKNVVIENSVIWRGVHIGSGTKISNSVIYSDVGENATIDNLDH